MLWERTMEEAVDIGTDSVFIVGPGLDLHRGRDVRADCLQHD
ncbi:MAG: hypothetical protein WKG07_06805 [Hymenobacter sp.]